MTNPRETKNTRTEPEANPEPPQSVSPPEPDNPLLTAALWYAEKRGYPVFPLHSVDDRGRCSCGKAGCDRAGKHPRTRYGHTNATTDHGRIRRWWSRWPDANIGIPTGERTKLLVLDVDDTPGLEALEAERGRLTPTLTTETGSGGMHYCYRYPSGERFGNSSGNLPTGFDIRGEGGYIVAPPSRTKRPYKFLDRVPIAEPPAWLLEALRRPYRASSGASDSRSTASTSLDGDPIPHGTRNNALASIAGRLHDGSRTLEQLAEDLQRINNARCVAQDGRSPDPLPGDEVWHIARSVHRLEPCKAAPEPPAKVLEDVGTLYASVIRRLEWKGIGGKSDRAVYVALLITARQYGRGIRSGVKVYISIRDLAERAGLSKQTVIAALKRLAVRKLVYRASKGRGTGAGALVLRVPQSLPTQPRGGGCKDSGKDLRDVLGELLRLRWGPGRIGKTGAFWLEQIFLAGGETTLTRLSDRTGVRRDNIRRSLNKLETPPLVECSGETYRLVPDFLRAIENELEATGILRVERLQRERHERERLGYVALLEERRLQRIRSRAGVTAEPDGFVSKLERVEPEKLASSPVPGELELPESPPVASVSEVFAMARERFNLPAPVEAPPEPDRDSSAAFVASELNGVAGMRYREMLRCWKELGGEPAALEEAIKEGPYRFRREPLDFNQPYVYRAPNATRRESAA